VLEVCKNVRDRNGRCEDTKDLKDLEDQDLKNTRQRNYARVAGDSEEGIHTAGKRLRKMMR